MTKSEWVSCVRFDRSRTEAGKQSLKTSRHVRSVNFVGRDSKRGVCRGWKKSRGLVKCANRQVGGWEGLRRFQTCTLIILRIFDLCTYIPVPYSRLMYIPTYRYSKTRSEYSHSPSPSLKLCPALSCIINAFAGQSHQSHQSYDIIPPRAPAPNL